MTSSPGPSFLCLHSFDKCVLVYTDSSLCSCMVLGLYDLVSPGVSHRHVEFCKLLSPTLSPQQKHSSKERLFKTMQELYIYFFVILHQGLFSVFGWWVDMPVPCCAWRGQKTTCRNSFLPHWVWEQTPVFRFRQQALSPACHGPVLSGPTNRGRTRA